MRTLTISAIALGACLAAPACSSLGSTPSSGPLRPAEARTYVEVSNHNWSDMVVYAVRSGMRYRLGMITTNQTRSFALPRGLDSLVGELRLVADPIGGSGIFDTGSIQARPGQTIELSIENHLAISNYAVWNR